MASKSVRVHQRLSALNKIDNAGDSVPYP